MSVRTKFRHLQRYREIAVAFVRNGFGYIAKDLGLPDTGLKIGGERRGIRKRTVGERIRMFLEELGPTFVKLGQMASTRPDLIPAGIITELERLQDQVQPFTYLEAVHIIEHELGMPIERLFAEFSEVPMASASIGQVYRARLIDGTSVAVKVQRPHIQKIIETDLDILSEIARVAEHRLEWARSYRVRDMMDEIAKALRSELDYELEARNAERFAAQSSKLDGVIIPAVYWDYTSKLVMTMDYVEGIKLSDRDRLVEEGYDCKKLGERYAKTIFHQVLVDGFFHGDPHPGNVLALPDGNLAFLDFGMVGRLTPDTKKHFATFVIGLRNQSTSTIIRAINGMGFIPDDTNMKALRADVDEMRDKYYKVPLSQVKIGESVSELFALAFRHGIRIPSELTLLGKTFLTMEGVATSLDPAISVFDVAEPFGRKLVIEKLDPRRLARKWVDDIPDYLELLSDVPLSLRSVLNTLRKGRVGLDLAIPELNAVLKKMDQISNRLSLSIVLLSFSIIMVGLIIGSSMGHQSTVLWNIPAIEIGFGIASILFVWLIVAIIRSR
ncbi:ABC1 kinase family protein [Paenibacillus glycanilyticus]|uniref:ABC transporter n=1 Tax=Paenibacillus glycanilyticus TaxID=126569 RepID=A0ABQ6GH05_9BACL|nr:AarF/ABC1/UbiB kinase family protein [Paenibacillus glycanilyticus]GLX69370.1 ABC transporter [Paenibacillus glycanilyticus]